MCVVYGYYLEIAYFPCDGGGQFRHQHQTFWWQRGKGDGGSGHRCTGKSPPFLGLSQIGGGGGVAN